MFRQAGMTASSAVLCTAWLHALHFKQQSRHNCSTHLLCYIGLTVLQTFAAYVTLGNQSHDVVASVSVKVELSTERGGHVPLYDNSAAPLSALPAGSRHEMHIQYDIKELGVHTIACSTVYTGEH